MDLIALFDAACRGATVALLLLLAAHLDSLRRSGRGSGALGGLGLALALGLAVQVVAAQPAIEGTEPSWWRAPLVGISMGNAVLGWLFVRALCDDDFRWRPWHRACWAAVVLAGTLNLGWLLPWCARGGPGWVRAWSQAVLGLLPLLFGLLSAVAAVQHWRGDLVERRRWLRAFIVVGGTVYTLAQVVARQQRPDGRLDPPAALADAAMLLLIVGAVAWMLLRPDGGLGAIAGLAPSPGDDRSHGRAPTPPDTPAGAAAADEPLEPGLSPEQAVALEAGMREQHWYRDPELSLAGLADRLGVPEYRLRRHINGRLGHRNFPSYLNAYRLAEACQALADPARRQLPVLGIALEAGFGSIGPFNRAFKAATGLTPSDFRRQALADSRA